MNHTEAFGGAYLCFESIGLRTQSAPHQSSTDPMAIRKQALANER